MIGVNQTIMEKENFPAKGESIVMGWESREPDENEEL